MIEALISGKLIKDTGAKNQTANKACQRLEDAFDFASKFTRKITGFIFRLLCFDKSACPLDRQCHHISTALFQPLPGKPASVQGLKLNSSRQDYYVAAPDNNFVDPD